MIYILESPDGAGKSTTANLLADKLGYKIIKGSSFEQSKCTQDELFHKFLDMIINHPQAIFDRFHISNYVYADLYNDYARIDSGEKRFLESMLETNKAKLVYLYADVETLQDRIRERGDSYIKVNDIEKIAEKYEEIFEETNYPYVKIDTTKYNPEQIVDIILNT